MQPRGSETNTREQEQQRLSRAARGGVLHARLKVAPAVNRRSQNSQDEIAQRVTDDRVVEREVQHSALSGGASTLGRPHRSLCTRSHREERFCISMYVHRQGFQIS